MTPSLLAAIAGLAGCAALAAAALVRQAERTAPSTVTVRPHVGALPETCCDLCLGPPQVDVRTSIGWLPSCHACVAHIAREGRP